MYVCIGTNNHLILKFLNSKGCGEKWDFDPEDGKCPLCRGYLVPESHIKSK